MKREKPLSDYCQKKIIPQIDIDLGDNYKPLEKIG